jgi:hypothetical protein
MTEIANHINFQDILQKYNIDEMKEEIIKFKKYNIQRLTEHTEHKCSNNKCVKMATYINFTNTEQSYLCWYHGLILTKQP